MRDIRDDLRQRLDSLRQERDEIQAQLQAKLLEIDLYEQHLDGLLALEEKRAGTTVKLAPRPVQPLLAQPTPEREEPEKTAAELNAEFDADVLSILSDGEDWQHGDIKAEMLAKGWEPDAETSLGRQLQGTLVSLMKNKGLIESAGKGVWRIAKKINASAA